MYYRNYEVLRDKKNLTDYKVAQETGISRSTFSDWKTGAHTPNLENLKRIASYFKVSLDRLCREEKEE
jgi:transcriptional regulator with XRE-family HTH domain